MMKNLKCKVYIDVMILSLFITTISCHSDDSKENNKETFRDDFNTDTIDAAVWQVATWYEHGGQTGTERCYAKNGYLNMKFINNNGTYLSSAIQTRKEFLYGRWEARIKPSSVPGVLNSLYTIDWDDTTTSNVGDDGTKQEIDIEFLTFAFGTGKGKVHFAVHASGLQSFDTNPDVDLDFDPSADFHIWGFNITPDHIDWFVDNKTLLTYKYSEHAVAITAPYQLKLNAWSSTNWISGPPASGVECLYLIDWIRFIPYE